MASVSGQKAKKATRHVAGAGAGGFSRPGLNHERLLPEAARQQRQQRQRRQPRSSSLAMLCCSALAAMAASSAGEKPSGGGPLSPSASGCISSNFFSCINEGIHGGKGEILSAQLDVILAEPATCLKMPKGWNHNGGVPGSHGTLHTSTTKPRVALRSRHLLVEVFRRHGHPALQQRERLLRPPVSCGDRRACGGESGSSMSSADAPAAARDVRASQACRQPGLRLAKHGEERQQDLGHLFG